MKLVVFGLTVTSSWGNGHATLWRGLIAALQRRGCRVVFFEQDTPYYARHRDLHRLPAGEVVLYPNWDDIRGRAIQEAASADVAIVTSYCPDGRAASALVQQHARFSVFYDMDTPVTLARIAAGQLPAYLPEDGLGGFDLVLSYTGGRALVELEQRLRARRAAPLYGHVDPDLHRPVDPEPRFVADLSYLGTFAHDRQAAVEALYTEPARLRPELRFLLGGAGYGWDFPWRDNIFQIEHVAPAEHAAFFSSSRLTLNVTRGDMAALGYCPSGRLFEAAACGAPVVSDAWEGLELFFEPGREILVAQETADVLEALDCDPADLAFIAAMARERVLDEHTCHHRAAELLELLASPPATSRQPMDEAGACGA
jgi:spore maturation protein CgeB